MSSDEGVTFDYRITYLDGSYDHCNGVAGYDYDMGRYVFYDRTEQVVLDIPVDRVKNVRLKETHGRVLKLVEDQE